MSSADERRNFLFQKKKIDFQIFISNFHYHIWIQYEKCMKMSTNKPSIGAVVLEITLTFQKTVQILTFPDTKTVARVKALKTL